MESLDHLDPLKVTWSEFLDWFRDEAKTRDRIHNAKLYEEGLKRLVMDQTTRKLTEKRTEYKVT